MKTPKDTHATAMIKLDDCVVDTNNFPKTFFSFKILPPLAAAGEAENEIMWVICSQDERKKLECIDAVIKASFWSESDSGKLLHIGNIVY